MNAEAGDEQPRPTNRRLFFALWPDAAVRTQIVRATREPVRLSGGGRPVPKDRLHVTVAFLGGLTEAGLEVARSVPPIAVGPFDLALDRLGVFANGGVLWLGPSTVPAALVELERKLWNDLEEHGFMREERIYQPHVTLARRARPVEAEVPALQWHVTELALVESLPDGRNVHYEVLETWRL
jgi:RNA 2',3'-cyclic 3'-phosphodiesterase